MVTSVAKGGTAKLPKQLRLSKPTDMTIHWKALVNFLMVSFSIQPFSGKRHFLDLSQKPQSLVKEL
jgi:hypothetical protein